MFKSSSIRNRLPHLIMLFFMMGMFVGMAQQRPNVLLILADDMGYGDLGIHGNRMIQTPVLDRLAKQGMEMKRFYVSPLCAPTRASILTGRYHLSTGVISVSKGLEVMQAKAFTLAELFDANGYANGIFGKWHNGAHYPNRAIDQGFDEHFGFSAGHLSNYFDPVLEKNGEEIPTKGYITDLLTDAAIGFMKDQQLKGKPFFCYVPFNAPHSPFQLPDAYFNKYASMGLDARLASIYGMVEHMDHSIGRLLDHLKKSGLEEQTIVIFLSDNGPNGERYNAGLKGTKGSVLEGGIRVPFFIRWPGKIAPSSGSNIPAAHIDIFPTLQSLCSLKSDEKIKPDGLDLSSLVLGASSFSMPSRSIFSHVNQMTLPLVPHPGSMLMEGMRYARDKSGFHLYAIGDDPESNVNQYDSTLPLVKRMDSLYNAWFSQQLSGMNETRPIILSEKGAELPAYEADVTSGIGFKEGHAWAHDWISDWHSITDSISWKVDCIKSGTYAISMEYLCPNDETGSTVELSFASIKKRFRITNGFQSDTIQGYDRFPRIEAPEMKSWGNMWIGNFPLEKGLQSLSLKAVQIPAHQVAAFRRLRVQFISPASAPGPGNQN
jgi:arylsulfatase A